MAVRDYLAQLKENRKGKPPQVKEALEIYIGLWKTLIEQGTVSEEDDIDSALLKIDQAGGLNRAADQGISG